MSINRMNLKNFKCFRELDLTLPKITLLTGANSSGKSSVLYGLLAPFQSNEFPLYLSPNGKYVNMGDFIEMSFGNSKGNEIEIDFSIDNTDRQQDHFQTTWVIDPINSLPKLKRLCVIIKEFVIELASKLDSGYTLLLKDESPNFSFRDTMRQKSGRIDSDHNISSETDIKQGNNRSKLEIDSLDELTFGLNGRKNPGVAYALREIFSLIERLDHDLNFISSFRHQPERTYYQKAKADNKVGRFGEGYIDQILEWQDRKSAKFSELNAIMSELTLLQAVSAQKLTGGRFEVRVQVQDGGPWCSLADVGFGISQFLPIIVADLQLSSNSTLLVAQPEIHLHPSVQATLGDYLVRRVKQENKRYIIETHSEYLLNRIRLAIAKGEIEPSDVAIYYFANSTDGSTTYPVEFTQDGQIIGAPREFFDTYMMDVMEIALHA